MASAPTVAPHGYGDLYKVFFIKSRLSSMEDWCYLVFYSRGNRVFEMSCANKYSAGDISELTPGTRKSIILCGWLQNNMAKQMIAQSKGGLM